MKYFARVLGALCCWGICVLSPGPASADEGSRASESYILPSGETVSFEQAWRRHVQRYVAPRPHWARALGEEAGMLALGAVWYWASRDLNAEDWDIEPNFAAVSKRFTSPSYIRFDTNNFWVNELHVLAGAAYYGFARNNNIGPLPSLLYGVLTSAAWEYLIEFREYVSLNDLVISPYGGQAVGEVLYKWGELYRVMGNDLPFAARALTILFSAPRALHEALGDEPVEPWLAQDGPPMQHDFWAEAGAVMRSQERELLGGGATVVLQTEVVDMPGWQMPGRFDTFYRDGNFTYLDLALAFDDDGVNRADIAAWALLAGYHHQNISEQRWGHALTLGISRGAWLDRQSHAGLDDIIAMVDMAGPGLIVDLFLGPLRARASLRAYFDLGMVTPLAYDEYVDEEGEFGVRSELVREGYYFGYGGNFAPALELELGPTWAELEMEYGRFRDFGGPDRVHHNDLPTPLRLLDTRLVTRAALGVHLYRGLGLRMRYEHTTRSGLAESFLRTRKVEEFSLGVGYRF